MVAFAACRVNSSGWDGEEEGFEMSELQLLLDSWRWYVAGIARTGDRLELQAASYVVGGTAHLATCPLCVWGISALGFFVGRDLLWHHL